MVSERSLKVLHAIITDYVANNEPVGSKSLALRYPFGVSAATIRNDMVALEEAELISTPHTSAGRVPTDKGFRLYLDTLTRVQPLSRARKAAIEKFLGDANDLEEVMTRSVRLLSQLTNQVAIVQYPSAATETVRHIDLVPLSDSRLLSVLIMSSGAVQQQMLVLPAAQAENAWVNGLRERIFKAIVGSEVASAIVKLEDFAVQKDEILTVEAQTAQAIIATVIAQLVRGNPAKLKVAGTANLYRADFVHNYSAVLEALEEQVTLLQLFDELDRDRQIAASIGRENAAYGLSDTAIVATNYATGEGSASKLGVLGPVSMDYAANIAAVRAVARYLSKMFTENN